MHEILFSKINFKYLCIKKNHTLFEMLPKSAIYQYVSYCIIIILKYTY